MLKRCITPAVAVFALVVFAAGASAQATRTWVSGVGDDVNPCSRTAPCKTFGGTISKTAIGGEMDALDPGGFGAVTITKAMTIDGGGTFASILAAGTNGVNVNAPGAVVTLRRLSINGAGTGVIGVNIIAARQVNIDDCEIFGFGVGTGRGVSVGAGVDVNLVITRSRIRNNLTAGVFIGGGRATIQSSEFAGNGGAGLEVNGASPLVLVSNSSLSMNDTGIRTGGSAIVRITHLDIFANTSHAWEITGGAIQTHVDNRIGGVGAGATGVGTMTPVTFP